MKGIMFNNLHSFRDLNLILSKKEMGSPAVKENKIDIPGADGALDLTEFFGEPKYEDVTHKFEFSSMIPQSDFLSQFTTIKDSLHGKKQRIILDDDPLFYYIGRLYVSSFTTEKGIGMVSVEAVCDPYKYKIAETVKTQAVNGSANIVLVNSRKRVVPTIKTTAAMTFSFGEWSTNRSTGTFVIPELELVEGNNTIAVSGTGTVTFTYREGGL